MTAPQGYSEVPANPGWWLKDGSDAAQESSWLQMPPDGFEYDPANPGWALRVGGDPQNQSDWWHNATVQDAPAVTGLVTAIDVSSAQPGDLTDLIAKVAADLVIVKLYQTVESIGGRETGAQHSAAQIASAQAAGKMCAGYIWGYRDRDPRVSIQEGVKLSDSCGLKRNVMFMDIETYGVTAPPSGDWINAALDECKVQGLAGVLLDGVMLQPGTVYSGLYLWGSIGNPSLPGVGLWSANYNRTPTLDTPSYGDMTLIGHQYSDTAPDGTPLDCSVFSAAFAVGAFG